MSVSNYWMTPEEVADFYQVPLGTVRQWRARSTGPVGHRVGRHVRYRRDDVMAWPEQQQGVA